MRTDLNHTGKILISKEREREGKKRRNVSARTENRRILTAQHNLIIVGGVSLDAVSHEESVRARGDEGMTRSHNLKAQEAECTQQGC